MDKRTFLFVLALTMVLFGVNIYFEQQHQEKVKEWNAKQEAKNSAAKKEENSAKVSPAPFVNEAAISNKIPNREEKFYVIQNNYQQLVFSNIGGALAEINLPFETSDNKESVVKETEFDRELLRDHPDLAHFPLRAYYTPTKEPGKFIEHEKGSLGGYYPLLRRGLNGQIPPRFYAGNVVSDYPEVAELVYDVKEFTDKSITFEANQPHRRITKTYSVESELKDAPYCINLTVTVEGDAKGLWVTTGVPEVEWISGSSQPALKYRITRNDRPEVILLDLPKDKLVISSISPDWASNSNGFLGVILDPLTVVDPGLKAQYVPGKTAESRLVQIDEIYDKFKADDLPGYNVLLPVSSTEKNSGYRLYAGPFATNVLKAVDAVYTNSDTGYTPDYIASQTFHGWFAFISAPFAKFLFILMSFFHGVTGSWGFSIILLTVALRIMLYPLNAWSTKSMIKMQKIAPHVTALQERYKKDPKKAQLEVLNLYRQEGVNPASGCLPLLIQMPFLIGMFDLLKSSFELRGASFIPGWINDLSAPDVLFSWATPIPFIGHQFHLLPILLGLVMFLQQKMSSTMPKDVSQMTDQQRQQKAMGTIMAAVFAIMFYHFPSGLNIYWLSSMLLGMLQQWWMASRIGPQKSAITKAK